MVALIEVVLGLLLAGLALLELTGKTDFLGRKKRERIIERAEARAEESEESEDDRPF